MAPPIYNNQKQEAWRNDSEVAEKHEKYLENLGKLFTPLPVQQDIRHLSPVEQDNVKLKAKIIELSNELDDAYKMLELASTKYLRVKIDVKKLRGTLDFVNGSEFIWASINENTNVLEQVDIKP